MGGPIAISIMGAIPVAMGVCWLWSSRGLGPDPGWALPVAVDVMLGLGQVVDFPNGAFIAAWLSAGFLGMKTLARLGGRCPSEAIRPGWPRAVLL